MKKWHKVNKSIPKYQPYLLWVRYADGSWGHFIGSFNGEAWFNIDDVEIDLLVTHYTKLPEGPK